MLTVWLIPTVDSISTRPLAWGVGGGSCSAAEVLQSVSEDEQQAIKQAEQGYEQCESSVHFGFLRAGDQTPEDQSADGEDHQG